jgi:hypothetical protein
MVIAIFSFIYLAYCSIYLLIKRISISFSLCLLGYAIYSQLLLTLLKIGYASPKVYSVAICAAVSMFICIRDRNVRLAIKSAFVVFIPYLGITVWALLHNVIAGTISAINIYNLISDQGISLLFLFSMICVVRNKEHLLFVVFLTMFVLVMDFSISVLQFIKYQPAWDVYHALRPVDALIGNDIALTASDVIANTEYGGVPGICNSPFTHGYIILTFGMFFITYLVINKNKYISRLIAGFLSASMFATLYMAMSRSGLVFYAGIVMMILFAAPIIYKNIKISVGMISALVVTCAVACTAYMLINSLAWQNRNFQKMENYYDYGRITTYHNAVDEIFDHPLIGFGSDTFQEKYGVVAHNAFLNAGIYYGFAGILLLVFHYGTFIYLNYSLHRSRISNSTSWITQGAFWGFVGYCANGMFHNESFITGGVMAAIILGLWIRAHMIENQEDLALRKVPIYHR